MDEDKKRFFEVINQLPDDLFDLIVAYGRGMYAAIKSENGASRSEETGN
ncbi:MAG: hypothetical protein Q4C95_11805 [Planctomycetia bacterium]|nr:hypothetical protein [Planctomycetia bacterium]